LSFEVVGAGTYADQQYANKPAPKSFNIHCFSSRLYGLRKYQAKVKVELVDRWFPSSKTSSKCGHVQPMKLKDRVFNCGSCGHKQDRDKNAATNLENAPNDRVRLA
jgi:hypothetical protein